MICREAFKFQMGLAWIKRWIRCMYLPGGWRDSFIMNSNLFHAYWLPIGSHKIGPHHKACFSKCMLGISFSYGKCNLELSYEQLPQRRSNVHMESKNIRSLVHVRWRHQRHHNKESQNWFRRTFHDIFNIEPWTRLIGFFGFSKFEGDITL